jgi:glycosyltransferase involved in cell wall biosynthesis
MNTPLVTVLMPAYNAEKYIGEAIISVLAQTFRDFELLIINDGSTDNTEKIIRSYIDSRIRLVNRNNEGVAAALNYGLSIARADYIARFDADDICLPERLKKQFNFLINNPDYVLAGSDAEYIDKDGVFVFALDYPAYTDEDIRQLSLAVCPFSHVTVMYKKEAVIAAGMYNVNAHTFEDHLLWHKLIESGKVCNIKEVLVKVRFNPGSVTIDDEWRGKQFKMLKYTAIDRMAINEEEGNTLLQIIRRQDKDKIKHGAYYSLLAKKYLFNNYDKARARQHIKQLIKTYPTKIKSYALLGLSFMPRFFLRSLYKNR